MNTQQRKIESLLFYRNEPVRYSWLAKKLGLTEGEIKQLVHAMLSFYENRGIALVCTEEAVALMTSESSSELLQEITKSGEERELSKQALETLAIILYRGRITKSEIDYIRGVNSVFILRNLLIRGLVSKKQNLLDKRAPFYIPTHDLFSFLGITSSEELPERNEVFKKLEQLENDFIEEQNEIKKEPIVVNSDNA